jgi:hypothetical protein
LATVDGGVVLDGGGTAVVEVDEGTVVGVVSSSGMVDGVVVGELVRLRWLLPPPESTV